MGARDSYLREARHKRYSVVGFVPRSKLSINKGLGLGPGFAASLHEGESQSGRSPALSTRSGHPDWNLERTANSRHYAVSGLLAKSEGVSGGVSSFFPHSAKRRSPNRCA